LLSSLARQNETQSVKGYSRKEVDCELAFEVDDGGTLRAEHLVTSYQVVESGSKRNNHVKEEKQVH